MAKEPRGRDNDRLRLMMGYEIERIGAMNDSKLVIEALSVAVAALGEIGTQDFRGPRPGSVDTARNAISEIHAILKDTSP